MERALREQYRRIGIEEVVEALPASRSNEPAQPSSD
jgi:hypothetical protein